MAFLRKTDFFTEIREEDLDVILKQLTQATSFTPDQVFAEKILQSQEEVETMIRHRYDVRKIFTDILTFSLAESFKIEDLIEYSEPAYDATITYLSGDRRSFSQTVGSVLTDDIFAANTPIGTPEAFDPSKWDKITENFSLYVCKIPSNGNLPDTSFAFSANAFTGNHDEILGWDKLKSIFFIRKDDRITLYHSAADRTNDINSIGIVRFKPEATEFPAYLPIERGTDEENIVSGDLSIIGFIPDLQEWDVIPTNFFTKEDNRDRVIKKIVINLVVFELHKLINPRNIPDLRLEAKDDSMTLLTKISNGKIMADLPIFHDEERGLNISFNSNLKLGQQY